MKPKKLLERLKSAGRLDALKRTTWPCAARAELLAEEAKPISVEEAEAKGKLWTPGAEAESAPSGELWTPDR